MGPHYRTFSPAYIFELIRYLKKDFGTLTRAGTTPAKEFLYGGLFALAIGFYDGFIGPGAGSFMVLFFIAVLGFDFLHASAHAKLVNMATNLGSIVYFAGSGHILYRYALPMALFNILGSLFGARLAILRGNSFIRKVFLVVVMATLLRLGYDLLP